MLKRSGRMLTPPLGEFIDCLWHAEGDGRQEARERTLPAGAVDLVIDLGREGLHIFADERDRSGHRYRGPVLFGASSQFYVIGMASRSPVVGVHFRPGGASPFFTLPIYEIANQSVLLEDVWGRRAGRLLEQLGEAATPHAMFEVLERSLLARLAERSPGFVPMMLAVERIEESPTQTHLRDVVDEIGFSHKHFIDLFKNVVGLTPKTFCRIQRFQAALDVIASGSKCRWAKVALDCGYFDQSHMIRDFRAFAGVTPEQYRPAAPNRMDHVVVEK